MCTMYSSTPCANIVVPCLHMPIFPSFTCNNVLTANCHSMQCSTCSNRDNNISMLQACPQCVARAVIPKNLDMPSAYCLYFAHLILSEDFTSSVHTALPPDLSVQGPVS